MKKRKKETKKKTPSCREHSCNKPRGPNGFCSDHKDSIDRYHESTRK